MNNVSLLLKKNAAMPCFALLLLVMLAGEGWAREDGALPAIDDRATTEPITVLTWNLEHFTDPFDNPYIDSPQENDGSTKDEQVLARLALAIQTIDPDVMALQEVESDRAVKFFLDEFLPDHDYLYFASMPSREWYQNSVIVSRFPLGAVVSFREQPVYNEELGEWRNLYNSRLLLAEVQVSREYSFWVASLHLKAGRQPEDFIWRREQVKVVKDFLQKMNGENLNAVVMGDMNFRPGSESHAVMTGGDFPLNDPFAAQGGVPTHPSSAPEKQIDYLLFSDGMKPEYVPGSASIATPLSIDQLSTISDHLPVTARFYRKDM